MNLNPGDRIELGGVEYTVERKLGSGAVALAYLAVTGEMQVVIKLPGVQDEARLDGMRDEARVLRTLNAVEDGQYGLLSRVVERIARSAQTRTERCVVALYDHGEFAGRPYLVQEVAPPEVNRRAVQTLSDEYRTITIMAKVARGMALAHDQGFALKDFEPPIKSDRIRVEWPESAAAPVVLLIDWNITGGRVDFRKDLFMFGGHLYAMLLGRSLELIHHRPPQTLGMGVPTWRNLSEGAQMLLAKLLHRDEQRRYLTSAELADDLIWHGQLLQTVQKDPPPTLHTALADLAYAQLGQNRFDRLLSITDLALRRSIGGDQAQTFEALRQRARRELDKAQILVLTNIEISLGAQQYGQAIREAERALANLESASELTRRVRHLKLQAQIGQDLRQAGIDDPRTKPEWQTLLQGLDRLANQNWDEALSAFQRAEAQQPQLATSAGLSALKNLARAGQNIDRAGRMREGAQPNGPDIRRVEWTRIEDEKLTTLEEAQQLVAEATVLAPEEQPLQEVQAAYGQELARRRAVRDPLGLAHSAWLGGRFDELQEPLQRARQLDSQNIYLLELQPDAARFAEYKKLLDAGEALLQRGEYTAARQQWEKARQAFPERSEWRQGINNAGLGEEICRAFADRRLLLDQKYAKLKEDTPLSVLRTLLGNVQQLQALQGKPLGEIAKQFGIFLNTEADTSCTFVIEVQLSGELEHLRSQLQRKLGQRVTQLEVDLEEGLQTLQELLKRKAGLDADAATTFEQNLLSTLETLRVIEELKGSQPERAQQLVEAWWRGVRHIENLEAAAQVIEHGLQKLPDDKSTQPLHRDRDCLHKVQKLRTDLENLQNPLLETRSGLDLLDRLDMSTLQGLCSQQTDWPTLRKQIESLRTKTEECIDRYLKQEFQSARRALEAQEYDQVERHTALTERFDKLYRTLGKAETDSLKELRQFRECISQLQFLHRAAQVGSATPDGNYAAAIKTKLKACREARSSPTSSHTIERIKNEQIKKVEEKASAAIQELSDEMNKQLKGDLLDKDTLSALGRLSDQVDQVNSELTPSTRGRTDTVQFNVLDKLIGGALCKQLEVGVSRSIAVSLRRYIPLFFW